MHRRDQRGSHSMVMETHKPMSFLKPADGAIGAHAAAVPMCYHDFRELALKIASQAGVMMTA